ncbi:beta-ketoacyl-[acyl-carrier-protein] synthase family protein [Kangiella sediminilitoris]|uniref:Beta-ketoacyl synthase n=1 Tax=Kangiella sediminilitoris TaxID=1144748 RepID=A0A1B3BE26_9GAMM|nr:beta-ketoacyl-[acyl-carrier-protein] synthase family protein [Kangiella sediminilitoris]AOE50985.1 Beta-ketoacyl synthase [Kangiella sediminilitoris]
MTSKSPVYINNMALINAMGFEHESLLHKLRIGDCSGMKPYDSKLTGHNFLVGKVTQQLPNLPSHLQHHNTRNNRLLLHCLQQLDTTLSDLLNTYSKSRVGVVMGTSTSGIAEGERALSQYMEEESFPDEFDYSQIQMSSPAEFVADYLGLKGPAYSISTACSSSGKVFASAQGMIQNDLCDVVIVGGADSLCDMTLNGFNSLEAVSSELCQPFSTNRCGINIGEGAAIFILSREPSEIELLGTGESSDAHHISAPHPKGDGAAEAMVMALKEAGLNSDSIDYLNLHGTATELNDSMESQAVSRVLGSDTPCSSTKPLTGHTLGAAGATEIGICWLLLQQENSHFLALHQYDGDFDPELPPINLVSEQTAAKPPKIVMSNSFAFGGNNVSVIIGRTQR